MTKKKKLTPKELKLIQQGVDIVMDQLDEMWEGFGMVGTFIDNNDPNFEWDDEDNHMNPDNKSFDVRKITGHIFDIKHILRGRFNIFSSTQYEKVNICGAVGRKGG